MCMYPLSQTISSSHIFSEKINPYLQINFYVSKIILHLSLILIMSISFLTLASHIQTFIANFCLFLPSRYTFNFPQISHQKHGDRSILQRVCLVTITSSSSSPGCFVSLIVPKHNFLLYRILHEQNVAQVAKITRRLGHHVVGFKNSS